ncbi:sugar transferase [Adlercreutzia sp.]|uniref:sugar transferase n=1 Tax=Adlercreutzia sp. TaxID=1872387 RepID=UPI003A85EFBB
MDSRGSCRRGANSSRTQSCTRERHRRPRLPRKWDIRTLHEAHLGYRAIWCRPSYYPPYQRSARRTHFPRRRLPPFFSPATIGKNLKPFDLVKFRNMTNERDENGELLPPEERTTNLGRFVRQHSLDELLNFWSVFKGDMSLIGPRPLPVEFTPRMTERHKMRYAVRPGLECPFLNNALCEQYDFCHARFENDILYVENVSFIVDVKQALRLVRMVLGRGQTGNYIGTDSHFIGYDEDGLAMSQQRLKNPEGTIQ